VRPADPRADPTVIDLIELAGLWLAVGEWASFRRTLARLEDEIAQRFPNDVDFGARFRDLRRLADGVQIDTETVRKAYRRATVG
jgi:hypothetical protein